MSKSKKVIYLGDYKQIPVGEWTFINPKTGEVLDSGFLYDQPTVSKTMSKKRNNTNQPCEKVTKICVKNEVKNEIKNSIPSSFFFYLTYMIYNFFLDKILHLVSYKR